MVDYIIIPILSLFIRIIYMDFYCESHTILLHNIVPQTRGYILYMISLFYINYTQDLPSA